MEHLFRISKLNIAIIHEWQTKITVVFYIIDEINFPEERKENRKYKYR